MTTDEDFSKTSTLKEKEKIQLYRYFQKFKAVEIKKKEIGQPSYFLYFSK